MDTYLDLEGMRKEILDLFQLRKWSNCNLPAFPENSAISNDGSALGGNGNGFNGINVVVKESRNRKYTLNRSSESNLC